MLRRLRSHVHDWLALVDRVPPADLIEQLLPATAYAYELRGPRRQQAWENMKKMRGLVRRIQNRGYATLSRIADHIDSLTAGDESNAVLEALDAVNLMTVHASKGLEFPVVFVVNLARGANGPARPIRVIMDGEAGEPSVSIGPFLSSTDELEREREKQETRRLMYVALTRARDRLYLSSALKDGVLQPGRGSLAEVLPDSIKELFTRAATAFEEFETLAWTGQSDKTYQWRVCRPPRELPVGAVAQVPSTPVSVDRFGPLPDPEAVVRLSVTASLAETPADAPSATAGGPQDVAVGTLVHRLFQFATTSALPAGADQDAEATFTRGLLRDEERAVLADVDDVVARAVEAWRAMRGRPEVAALLASGERLHEVPFSLRVASEHGARILRGTIDCLVRRADGSITVVEFKTGRRRMAHQQQLDVYVRAARTLFPEAAVEGILVYPS